ncbi:MAG: transporter [Syntrophaceae bacterium]|nr:transporter [Syntrophaceae bacterium]
MSSKSDSGVIVTNSGGAGRGRAAKSAGMASTTTVQESGIGDISMTTGWTLFREGERNPKVRPTLYLKVPTGDLDHGLGTGTVEASPGLSVSKWLESVQLFGEGAYIFQNSGSNYAGQNYVSYLGGAGIQATERLFVSALAKGSSPRSEGAEAQAEGRISLNFMHSRRISWNFYGSAGFTDASPDYGGGMAMIYRF